MKRWLFAMTMAGMGLAVAEVPGDFVRKTGQAMLSADAKVRASAYRAWDRYVEEEPTLHEKTLKAALRYHDRRLSEICRGQIGSNPYASFSVAYEELESERGRIMKLILTDWKKDSSKVAMLRNELKGLARLHAKVNKMSTVSTASFDRAFDTAAQAMTEVTRELERYDEEAESRDFEKDEDLKEELVEVHLEGQVQLERQEGMARVRDAAARLKAVNQANAGLGKWATEAMKEFSVVINRERDWVGLVPLRLEEKLSDASKGHSQDMVALGFFAHESPVEGKKTPWDRARVAGYGGSANGENIFAGSSAPQSAYDAWFASDGHRFIMFGAGADELGVGIQGGTWTMMTGKGR